jgi:hypothetical protein
MARIPPAGTPVGDRLTSTIPEGEQIMATRSMLQAAGRPEFQARIRARFQRGLQTNGATEANLGAALAEIATDSR